MQFTQRNFNFNQPKVDKNFERLIMKEHQNEYEYLFYDQIYYQILMFLANEKIGTQIIVLVLKILSSSRAHDFSKLERFHDMEYYQNYILQVT